MQQNIMVFIWVQQQGCVWALRKKEEGALRLPGGVVFESQESALEGAMRHAYESGLSVGGLFKKIHESTVGGLKVMWLWFDSARALDWGQSAQSQVVLLPIEEALQELKKVHLYQEVDTVYQILKK